MEHLIAIEPWPQYDELRQPWWNVRVEGERGHFSLAYTSAGGGRWAESGELRRLKNCSGRLQFRVEQHVRAVFNSVTLEREQA